MDDFVTNRTDRTNRQLSRHEVLAQTDLAQLWRLESGTLRIDSVTPEGDIELAHLALPGDVIGVEHLVGMPEDLTVRALTPAKLVPVPLFEDGQRTQLLMDAIVKGHRRCREIVSLRSGEAAVRLKRLLKLLAHSEHGDLPGPIACTLPSLKDIASIVNLTPESVCRILNEFRQAKQLAPRPKRSLHLAHGLAGPAV